MIGSSRAEKKVSAALRARQSLEQAWARIDYVEDTIKPAVLQVRELEKVADVEISESDLISLLTTGTMPIEQVGEGQ